MIRRALVAAALAIAAVAAVAADPVDAGDRPMRAQELRGVNFVSACAFSHRAFDDPIVHPGHRGKSHDHSFVGNRTTNAFSTLASLHAGGTTCLRAGDTAAYWMPTLYVDGRAVFPRHAQIYYRRKTTDDVRAFPPGLKVIAGDASARAAQPRAVTFWSCGAEVGLRSSEVPTCPSARRGALRLHVSFPSCWDGRNLDSADHQSHMAYPMRARCPATHPVAVPAITLIFRYPVRGGAHVELASGGQYSAHADFFNAWDQQTLERLVQTCLNALRHCARGD